MKKINKCAYFVNASQGQKQPNVDLLLNISKIKKKCTMKIKHNWMFTRTTSTKLTKCMNYIPCMAFKCPMNNYKYYILLCMCKVHLKRTNDEFINNAEKMKWMHNSNL